MQLFRWSFLVLCLTAMTWSQTREQQLNRAKSHIKQQKISQAIDILRPLVMKRWKTDEGKEAAVLLAESYLRAGQFDKAAYHARRFYDFYPSSPYQDRIAWVQVRLMIQSGDYFPAARKGFALLHRTQSKSIYSATKQQISNLLNKNVLNTLELENLLSQFQLDNDLVATLRFVLAKQYVGEERYYSARYQLSRLLTDNPASVHASSAKDQVESLKSKGPGKPMLLVVGPMSGALSNLGTQMLQGVALAIDEVKKSLGEVNYRKIDTQGEPALTVAAVRQALREDYVVGIIGPMMSTSASALASWLSVTHPHIPMVTPTATDDGIAELGYNIFQFNMPSGQLARDIARYAVLCEGLYEFAVLAPNSDYGEIMAREFSQEVKRYGGRIMSSDYYTEGLEDYAKQFEVIKALQWRNYRQRELISWGSNDTLEAYFNKGKGDYLKDSLIQIDGFFIPVSAPEDAALMSRQLSYHNIETQILGTDGWYGIETLRQGRKYVDRSLFTAPFLERNEIKEWKQFKKAFMKRWNQEPNKNRVSGLSYNAAQFMLSHFGENMVEKMRGDHQIKGVYGPINMDSETGGNHFSQIVNIKKNKFGMAPVCKEYQATQ